MGLLARYIEESGIPTVMLANLQGRTAKIKPPRTLLVPGPRGETAGPPEDRHSQKRRVESGLRLLETVKNPGEIVTYLE